MTSSKIESDFHHHRAKDNPFVSGGLRVYREYRDLGIGEATKGRVHAHIIRTTKPCPEGGSGMHYHDVDFQMVMVLKGNSRVWFEGQGEVTFEEGDCWIQPPGIKHNVLYYSEDYELLELTLPEKIRDGSGRRINPAPGSGWTIGRRDRVCPHKCRGLYSHHDRDTDTS